jgi:hypothetical protein
MPVLDGGRWEHSRAAVPQAQQQQQQQPRQQVDIIIPDSARGQRNTHTLPRTCPASNLKPYTMFDGTLYLGAFTRFLNLSVVTHKWAGRGGDRKIVGMGDTRLGYTHCHTRVQDRVLQRSHRRAVTHGMTMERRGASSHTRNPLPLLQTPPSLAVPASPPPPTHTHT